MIRRGWVVAGTMVAAGVPVVPATASGVAPVLDRVDGPDAPGAWVRAGEELRFRVRLTGPARAARLALAAGPARALTSVACAPAGDGAEGETASAAGESPGLTFRFVAPGGEGRLPSALVQDGGGVPVQDGGAVSVQDGGAVPVQDGVTVPAQEGGAAETSAGAGAVPPGVRSALRRAYAAAESARPVRAGRASACALGDVRAWREVDVRLAAPYGAREIVLAAVARMGGQEDGGVTVVSRVVALPVVGSSAGHPAGGAVPAGGVAAGSGVAGDLTAGAAEGAPAGYADAAGTMTGDTAGTDTSAGTGTGVSTGADAGTDAGTDAGLSMDAGVDPEGVGSGVASPEWRGRAEKHRSAFASSGQAVRLPRGRGEWAGSWDAATPDAATLDGASRDGATRDGATRDGATRDGATRDGATRDGATLDGASRDSATSDGASRDGATRNGVAWGGGEVRTAGAAAGDGVHRQMGHGAAARSLVEAPPLGGAVVPFQPSGPAAGPSFPAATPAPLGPPQTPVTGNVDGGLGAPLPRQLAMSAERPERSTPANVLAGPQGVAAAGGGIAVLLGGLWGVSRAQQARMRKKVR
ncbi:hypothetical protein [Nonomuraea indica]|uniref:Uncharacterized protein n=1 Tax=Nonomuraea indica TaxID=1581193 RepID=A0ABW8AC63_9ACTN